MKKHLFSRIVPSTGSCLSVTVRALLWCFVMWCLCSASYGAVITVPDDYSTIQAAIDASVDGDEIVVSPRMYIENINFGGKNVILRSTDPDDPDVVAATIIDGDQAGPVVTFAGTESPACVLAGFTITNGYARSPHGTYGGGINGNGTLATIQDNVISANSAGRGGGLSSCHGTIERNTISSNSAQSGGGGLWLCNGAIEGNTISGNSSGDEGGGLEWCEGIIRHNTISGNVASSAGGGVYDCDGRIEGNDVYGNSAPNGGGFYSCDGIIEDNAIWDNVAQSSGGGLCYCDGTIRNNAIYDNTAEYGGGLYGGLALVENNTIYGNIADYGGGLYDCDDTIRNNTVYGNTAEYGGGLGWCVGTVENCIIWQNSASFGAQLYSSSTPSYSCIQDWTEGGVANIADDPLLVDPDNGNFHLQLGSPCIDAGKSVDGLAGDFEGDPRGFDGTDEPRGDGSDYDIGADEYADTDGDGMPDWVETNTGVYVDETDTGTDPGNPDTDGDGLSDGEEINATLTDPNDADSDDDGMPDGWEMDNALDPLVDDSSDDGDGDGLVNLDEFAAGTDPNAPDTDGDGLGDGEEINTYLTNPVSADTDGDGFTDGDEVLRGTDPLDPDSFPVSRGGSCFIATAAYGTPSAREVGVLCEFRDGYLLTNRAGAACVKAYYRFSPPIARFVAAREPVRAIVRACLTPVAALAGLTMRFPQTLAYVALVIAVLGVVLFAGKSKRHTDSWGKPF